jgi:hypothetical protein
MDEEVAAVGANDHGGKMQEKETLDERLPALFEPDTLLPIQYFEAMRRKHLLEGEKRLILSVLEDAVECFMKYIDSATHKGQRLFREADEWISLEDKHWIFSFDNVCDMLDINSEYMRRGIEQWKERKLEEIQQRMAVVAQAEEAEGQKAQAPAAAESAEPEQPKVVKVGSPARPVRRRSGNTASRRAINLRKARA